MSPETHDPELAALAKALTLLAPSPGKIDRDQVLFRAGQALNGATRLALDGRLQRCGGFGYGFGRDSVPSARAQEIERIVYLRSEPSVAPTPPEAEPVTGLADALPSADQDPRSEPLTCRNLEQLVLRWGIDALPSSSYPVPERSGASEPGSPRTLRDYSDLLQADTTSSR